MRARIEIAPATVAAIVEIRTSRCSTWESSCPDDRLDLAFVEQLKQTVGHSHRGVLRTTTRRKGVGSTIGHVVEPRHRDARATGEPLHARMNVRALV
jgi:hypothetical protein